MALADAQLRTWHGDLVASGRGEILVPEWVK